MQAYRVYIYEVKLLINNLYYFTIYHVHENSMLNNDNENASIVLHDNVIDSPRCLWEYLKFKFPIGELYNNAYCLVWQIHILNFNRNGYTSMFWYVIIWILSWDIYLKYSEVIRTNTHAVVNKVNRN